MMSGPGHAGDMPNLHVPASGALDLEVLNTSITLDKDKPNSVFHAGGTAIVIQPERTTTAATQPEMPEAASSAA